MGVCNAQIQAKPQIKKAMLSTSNPLFRTPIYPQKAAFLLTYKHKMLLMGSCFVQNIGGLLQQYKFDLCINPFGIIYNPISIANGLRYLMQQHHFSEQDVVYHQEQWQSFAHHSRFSNSNLEQCLMRINQEVAQGHVYLKNANVLVLTFGTAWLYERCDTNSVVANCHKYPANFFRKRLCSLKEWVTVYETIIAELRAFNPTLQIIFTLSPVRHWRDGALDNQLSKAILRLGIQQLCDAFPQTHYFPSYEIMMDDLRDYRFYATDMLHPNETAVAYIWWQFVESFFTDTTKQQLKQVEKIVQARKHRPRNAASLAHQKFKQKQLAKIQQLCSVVAPNSFAEEIAYFSA